MASLFSHAVAACALGQAAPSVYRKNWRFWYMAAFCSCLPDADVLGFGFGIQYEDLWGHRGLTHSLLFALITGIFAAALLRPQWKRDGWRLTALFFLITASHGFLDAFTNGGLGVAFFSPFDQRRYFFPWTPIEVSPIGASAFFTQRGLAVIASELRWVWLPSLVVAGVIRLVPRAMAARSGR